MNTFVIDTPKGKREIGPGCPCFIIAEMSGNHNQDYNRAIQLIDVAVDAGVDAIKLQTYTADTITLDCDNEYFQVDVGNNAWDKKTLHQLYQEAHTPWEWQGKLKQYAEEQGVLLFSTPFDSTAVEFLETLDVQLYKVASLEVVDIPLLKAIGKTKKPVIMSRGMASPEDITYAIQTLKEAGCPQVAVLHCVSSYPATPEQMNLSTIPDIKKKYEVVAGLSDHTLGITVPVTSVALGASIIEKHFTLLRADGGPDAAFSLEPNELKELVQSVRDAEAAIGSPTYTAGDKESKFSIFKKSIFVSENIKKGETLTAKNIRVVRPGQGLHPKFYETVLGKKAAMDMQKGTPLQENHTI